MFISCFSLETQRTAGFPTTAVKLVTSGWLWSVQTGLLREWMVLVLTVIRTNFMENLSMFGVVSGGVVIINMARHVSDEWFVFLETLQKWLYFSKMVAIFCLSRLCWMDVAVHLSSFWGTTGSFVWTLSLLLWCRISGFSQKSCWTGRSGPRLR